MYRQSKRFHCPSYVRTTVTTSVYEQRAPFFFFVTNWVHQPQLAAEESELSMVSRVHPLSTWKIKSTVKKSYASNSVFESETT